MTDTEESPADPLQVRKPPPGLTRAERRDWREQEALRLAELQAQTDTSGLRALMATTPPRGLGRAGRRVWRDADRQGRSRRIQEESARTESDRYVGAMMVLAAIAIVIVLRLIFSGGSPDPAPGPAPTTAAPAVTSHVDPTGRGE